MTATAQNRQRPLLPIDITPAMPLPREKSFVHDSWRRSYEDSEVNATIPKRAYVAYMNEVIRGFIGADQESFDDVRPDCMVLVARDPDRQSLVYGWLVVQADGPVMNVVYAFVKKDWRRQRILGRLLARATELLEPDESHYCTRTRFDGVFARYGYTYLPFQEIELRGV